MIALRRQHEHAGLEALDIKAHSHLEGIATAAVIELLDADVPAIGEKLVGLLIAQHDAEVAVALAVDGVVVVLDLTAGEVAVGDLVVLELDDVGSIDSHNEMFLS